ncbi:MAG TPA: hypothetical protein VF127_03245 [Nitrospira sp.]
MILSVEVFPQSLKEEEQVPGRAFQDLTGARRIMRNVVMKVRRRFQGYC